jgi:hypothetical protein
MAIAARWWGLCGLEGFNAGQELVQVVATEGPVERVSDRVVAVLERAEARELLTVAATIILPYRWPVSSCPDER